MHAGSLFGYSRTSARISLMIKGLSNELRLVENEHDLDEKEHRLVPLENKDHFVESQKKKRFMEIKLEYLKSVEFCYKLDTVIQSCSPDKNKLLRCLDEEELKHCLMLFDVFVNVRRLCNNWLIQRVPSSSPKQHYILLKIIELTDTLKSTKMVAALPFPLLICGIVCTTSYERHEIKKSFEEVENSHHVTNLSKAWLNVQEYWKQKPTGDFWIDWQEVFKE